MSDSNTTPSDGTRTNTHISWSDSFVESQTALKSLSSIISTVPPPLLAEENPSHGLLHDPQIADQISSLLRQPSSGAGDNNLCRWLYDTFQTSKPDLQLVVLRFLPIIAGVYLSRVAHRKPLAGFEAVLLALYAHETSKRNGQAVTVSIPDLSHSSIYHETKLNTKNSATELNLAVISPSLEPHGTVRSTRRARIVGVALELYYSKISLLPLDSKKEFCEFCALWAGQNGSMYRGDPNSETYLLEEKETIEDEENDVKSAEGRVPLPWELLQPALRILGHCLMGPKTNKELHNAASSACRCLYARAVHDINPKAMLATGSLLRLAKLVDEAVETVDYTDIPKSDNISL